MAQNLDSSGTGHTSKEEDTSFDNETELNTADLSNISGLSEVLRADDSIADRVRSLLNNDQDTKFVEKPELLDDTKENPPSYEELTDRMVNLLQGSKSEEVATPNRKSTNSADVSETNSQRNLADSMRGKSIDSLLSKSPMHVVVTPEASPVATTIGRRSGDGADNEPATVAAESSDDIMNVSDATEYSDLPKVVDNPIKKVRTSLKSASQPSLSSTSAAVNDNPSKSLSRSSIGKIDEESAVIESLEPKASSSILGLEQQSLENVIPRNNEVETLENMERDGYNSLETGSGNSIPTHSTPHLEVSTRKSPTGTRDLTDGGPCTDGDKDRRSSAEVNVTVRSKDHCEMTGLSDDKILARVRKANNCSPGPASDLKGPHTSSEQSIASSVDSLGLKVRNLLKGGSSLFVPESNANDESSVSNYSEEISNFERTDLWKYTRQFLPGTLSSSRDVQPLEKFSRDTLVAESCPTSNSSRGSSPVTYRLAREVVTPVNEFGGRSEFISRLSSPDRSSKQGDTSSGGRMNTLRNRSLSEEKTPTYHAGQKESYQKSATYSSLGSILHKSSQFTPQNESYKMLQPHYSDTPYTPYSFVTPRRVAWEAEKEDSAVKVRSPYQRRDTEPPSSAAADKAPSIFRRETPVGKSSPEEISAYFRQTEYSGLQKSPQLLQRSPAISFKRLNPNLTNSFRNQNLTQRDKTTSTMEHSIDIPDEPVFAKPATPPFTRSKSLFNNPTHLQSTSHSNTRRSDIPTRSSPLRRSSPRSVTFGKDLSSFDHRTRSERHTSLPEYSFTTPKVFERPKKNITPKVVKENPRPTLSLPTYDQLVAEQEVLKILSSPTKNDVLTKNEPPEAATPIKEYTKDKSDGRNNSMKIQSPLRNSFNEKRFSDGKTDDVEFSTLQPEICFDESASDSDNSAICAKKLGSNMSSDNLHRRAAASCDEGDGVISSNHGATEESESPESAAEQTRVNHHQTDPESSSSPTEPAPLPYVRLTKKAPITPFRRSHTPPRHSISTEKVQNLLKKEKPVPRGRSMATSASFPPMSQDSSLSSDDDLLCLMETVATKVPLMHKLMKKLYERNLEKQMDPETRGADKRKKPEQVVKYAEQSVQTSGDQRRKNSSSTSSKTPMFQKVRRNGSCQAEFQNTSDDPKARTFSKSVDQSVQTCSAISRKCSASTDLSPRLSGCEKVERNDSHIAESACQTSFTQSKKRILVAHKSTSPMEGSENDFDDAEKDVSWTPTKGVPAVTHNKENRAKTMQPCAFFVDMTPEKVPKPSQATKNDHKPPPLAWYEPYEYVPVWKQRHEKESRKTLGFVDVNIQDAFLNNKRDFVIRSWERQEDIAIRAEERRLRDLEQHVQDQIQALHKEKVFRSAVAAKNMKPKEKKERNFGWKEMKLASKQKYDMLPEVVAKKKEAERKKYYEANRRRAEVYKQKITQMIVRKQKGKLSDELR